MRTTAEWGHRYIAFTDYDVQIVEVSARVVIIIITIITSIFIWRILMKFISMRCTILTCTQNKIKNIHVILFLIQRPYVIGKKNLYT